MAFSLLDGLLCEGKVHVAVEADLALRATPAVIGRKEPQRLSWTPRMAPGETNRS
ncbi:hypothetical protein [Corynebacterium glutamicum]|uniref:hypothetical protein n=1 Tax=Corynebacterium glutamicum TaxID=1718 RepID=UPI0012BC9F6C|nr:hypothetical protein [Corynebacterium glutamicum]NII88814.1 hypothetical protein [Corynebacterium glutamicum]